MWPPGVIPNGIATTSFGNRGVGAEIDLPLQGRQGLSGKEKWNIQLDDVHGGS